MSFSQCTYLAFPQIETPINVSANSCQLLHNACAMHLGYRYQRFYTDETDLTEWYVDYDFFTAYKPEFLFLARADLAPLLSSVQLYSSTDNISYTLRATISAPFSYVGKNNNDIFYYTDALGSYRYWRIKLNFSAATRVAFSKLMLGKLFDFNQNHSSFIEYTKQSENIGAFRSTSNIINPIRNTPTVEEYKIRFVGVSESVINSLLDNALLRAKRFCLLVNLSESAIFNHNVITHCELSRYAITKRAYNHNTLDFIATELIG
jgi:hypothetical protein